MTGEEEGQQNKAKHYSIGQITMMMMEPKRGMVDPNIKTNRGLFNHMMLGIES